MADWKEMLLELCDNPAEVEFETGTMFFTRHGKEYWLELKSIPGAGVCVTRLNDEDKRHNPTPIELFIQKHLLDLPRLAKQIQKTLDVARELRPKVYVDGPSELTVGASNTRWEKTQHSLEPFLIEAEPGATRLIQLMAAAGQGKTVLLEELAGSCAKSFQPDAHPRPLILLVDLLGRYVGNIDDAIAGSLNNTYLFPSLTQRDVVFCVKRQWLILALDGFDELVARVGARDAFLRISDLMDQLGGSGTIILSARESFFDLYQITASIRTYLQPKIGTYATSVIQLRAWDSPQGIAVFGTLGSLNPKDDLAALLSAFDNDKTLILQPFFLTRLAGLWLDGERFASAKGGPSTLSRTRYIIDAFIGREVQKWKDRDDNLILTEKQHAVLLASLAEEMWRSGAFRLTLDELRAASEVGLMALNLPSDRMKLVLERVPTHGALAARDRRYAFIHDRFFGYFLAIRIAACIAEQDRTTLAALVNNKELSPNVIEWVVWTIRENSIETEKAVVLISALKNDTSEPALETNVSSICIGLLAGHETRNEIVLSKLTFLGNVFFGRSLSYVTFSDCNFWTIDFSAAKLHNCRFVRCKFGDIRIDRSTKFSNTRFDAETSLTSVEVSGEGSYFAPDQMESRLKKAGMEFPDKPIQAKQPVAPRVSENASFVVERYVRASERTTDVVVEGMAERYGEIAARIARIGLQTKVMKKVQKDTSGANKTFVRFQVDRDRLLKSQLAPVGDPAIDEFWTELSKRYSAK